MTGIAGWFHAEQAHGIMHRDVAVRMASKLDGQKQAKIIAEHDYGLACRVGDTNFMADANRGVFAAIDGDPHWNHPR